MVVFDREKGVAHITHGLRPTLVTYRPINSSIIPLPWFRNKNHFSATCTLPDCYRIKRSFCFFPRITSLNFINAIYMR